MRYFNAVLVLLLFACSGSSGPSGIAQAQSVSTTTESCSTPGVITITCSPYNAVGDGSTDNFTVIQNAVNSGGASQITVLIPQGVFKVSASITVPSNVIIKGVSSAFGSQVLPSATSAFVFSNVHQSDLRDVMVDMEDAPGATAIVVSNGYLISIEDDWVWGAKDGCGICISGTQNVHLSNDKLWAVTQGGTGLSITNSATVNAFAMDIEQWFVGIGLDSTEISMVNFYGGHLENNGGSAIQAFGASYNLFSGLKLYAPPSGNDIQFLDGASNNTIENSLLSNLSPSGTSYYQDATSTNNLFINTLANAAVTIVSPSVLKVM